MALASLVDQPDRSDIFMAIIFRLMPASAQLATLTDPRIEESETVLPGTNNSLSCNVKKRILLPAAVHELGARHSDH